MTRTVRTTWGRSRVTGCHCAPLRNLSMCTDHRCTASGQSPRRTSRIEGQSPRSENIILACNSLGKTRLSSAMLRRPGSRLKSCMAPRTSGYCLATSMIFLSCRITAVEAKKEDQAKPWQSLTSTTFAIRFSRTLWLCSDKLRISTIETNHSTICLSSTLDTSWRRKMPMGSNERDMPSLVPQRAGSCSILKRSWMCPNCELKTDSLKSSMSSDSFARTRAKTPACSRRYCRWERRKGSAFDASWPWPRRKRQSMRSCRMSSGAASSSTASPGESSTRRARTCSNSAAEGQA
mmetsp:Transcript_82709/g.267810  ORF Transcript_82709/g.267810 Transcript_82709/m.267810 type:complete len:292 (+) Transcript_82709:549-1424(+)